MNLILDALRMIGDIRRTSRAVDVWGAALNVPQFLGGLFFIGTPEGLVVLATLVFTLVVAGQIHRRTPFSRLIGLCHLPWLVLLPWLVHRLLAHEHTLALKAWLAYVAVTMAVSLVFDALDVYRYRKGERTFAWAS